MAGMSSLYEHECSETRSHQIEDMDNESVSSKYSDDQTEVLIRGSRSYPLDNTQTATYKRRWYILALWCAVGFTNFEIWNTWGPIQDTAKFVFDWNTAQISWLVNMGLITLILLPPFFVYIIRHFGLRPAMVITVLTIAVGSAMRLIRSDKPMLTKFIIDTGQFLNGIGGVVPMAASTMLSLKWLVNLTSLRMNFKKQISRSQKLAARKNYIQMFTFHFYYYSLSINRSDRLLQSFSFSPILRSVFSRRFY